MGGALSEFHKIEAFRSALCDCELDDLDFEGFKFTWTNKQSGKANIQERLDRFVATCSWIDKFPHYKAEHLLRKSSDHCPIVLSWTKEKTRRGKKGKRFRFEAMWLEDESCVDICKTEWNKGPKPISVENLSSKIAKCGAALQTWEITHFGNINRLLHESRKELATLQSLSTSATTNLLMNNLEAKN